jgi:hypothetical protein
VPAPVARERRLAVGKQLLQIDQFLLDAVCSLRLGEINLERARHLVHEQVAELFPSPVAQLPYLRRREWPAQPGGELLGELCGPQARLLLLQPRQRGVRPLL